MDRLFSTACCNRRGNGFKLKERRFRLDIRKKFFTMRMVKLWQRLPRAVGDAPSLETFQARLDGALSNLIWVKMSLLVAAWLDWMAFKGPFQPKPFSASMIPRYSVRQGKSPPHVKALPGAEEPSSDKRAAFAPAVLAENGSRFERQMGKHKAADVWEEERAVAARLLLSCRRRCRGHGAKASVCAREQSSAREHKACDETVCAAKPPRELSVPSTWAHGAVCPERWGTDTSPAMGTGPAPCHHAPRRCCRGVRQWKLQAASCKGNSSRLNPVRFWKQPSRHGKLQKTVKSTNWHRASQDP